MPEKEYIEREAIAKHIDQSFGEVSTPFVVREIRNFPKADVAEVKHGYWKDTEYGFCSVCDRSISEIYDADSSMAYGILDELTVCPFCGAKMDGGKNGK